MRRLSPLILLGLVTACATIIVPDVDTLFGKADPTRFDAPAAPAAGESYAETIQPVLDRRCVVCHACYDAPCQLKTTSWEGIARGASKTPVYDGTRWHEAPPSRLSVDADKPSEWRTRGFFSVLNERAPVPEANRTAGLMHRLLTLKQRQPAASTVPASGVVAAAGGDLCPAEPEIDAYERLRPLGGMPHGLPAISPGEHRVLTAWLERGAPYEGPPPLGPPALERIATWERFLNGDALKTRLFARYAYEHLFLANLWFDDDPARQFFKLVRSATPPGQPVRAIRSRRPVDDPGVERVYYRLVPERETIVAKTHMPYALSAGRMQRWQALFLDPAYAVERLPGYGGDTAANPFATFAALPVGARYRFMLDEAEFTIMGFVKGPVCRGQIALDVIEDHFWVHFLAPSDAYDQALAGFLARDANLLRLPTGSSETGTVVPWLRYAALESEYQAARTALYAASLRGPENLDLRLIWDGEGSNANAALTVFRHFDSASVVKGLVGDPPKTAWVIGYPLLERIHYLLVANFDVYGNVGHQLNSRLYMDYLRMEGEFNFLSFLPQAQRFATRDQWYRGVGSAGREQVYGGATTTLDIESGIRFARGDAKRELLDLLRARLAPVLDTQRDLGTRAPPALRAPLRELADVHGASLQWMPEVAFLVVESPDGAPVTFSLLRNTAHASVSHLIGEGSELRPAEHTMTVVSGVLGSYPNAFYRLRAGELPAFTRAIGRLGSAADSAAFARRWEVRRDDQGFWEFSDGLHRRYAEQQPLEAGVLDYSRLGSR